MFERERPCQICFHMFEVFSSVKVERSMTVSVLFFFVCVYCLHANFFWWFDQQPPFQHCLLMSEFDWILTCECELILNDAIVSCSSGFSAQI